ncbi:MAG: TRAP transporter fused permease subunit [Desulfurococcales archaeon]|nr:TRAP transporter fused permease subunit [Desulfurococcales archaeon]
MSESVSLEEMPIEKEKLEMLKKIMVERAKTGKARKVIFVVALLFMILELFYVLGLNLAIINALTHLGVPRETAYILTRPDIFFQTLPRKGIILSLIIFSAIILYPMRRGKPTEEIPWYDWIIASVLAAMPLYIVYLYLKTHTVEGSITQLTIIELIFIPGILIAVLEATRRAFGIILPLIVVVFLGYGFRYAIDVAYARGKGLEEGLRFIFNQMIGQNTGVLGVPLEVMIIYVFAFLFFSSILEQMGIGRYITELILSLFGTRPGGPAKVAVVSSMLMGMISGSSVANVLTTGTFSIPTMKRAGFPPEIAGAVEPVASTGGQLMPPIMGAAAFIMAEFLGRPYRDIMIAAALPAVLYFYSIYVFVDKEAKRLHMRPLTKEELPDRARLLKKLYLTLPIFIIIVALLKLSPQHAVIASLGSAIYVAWLAADAVPRIHKIIVTLIVLGSTALFMAIGLTFGSSLLVMGVVMFLYTVYPGLRIRGAKQLAKATINSIELTLRNSVPVFLAAASASIVQSMIIFTQLPQKLAGVLIDISGGYIYLLLLLTAIFSIILGMGVPTTANYIITSTVLAPAIVTAATLWLHYPNGYQLNTYAEALGLSLNARTSTAEFASHMFVFYYGILADITPPVALAAFVGAVLAGADFWKTAINATKYGFAKYILPFIFVASPQLLVTSIVVWRTADYIQLLKVTLAAVMIIHAASSGFTGWLFGHIKSRILRYTLIVVSIAAVSMNDYLIALTAVLFIYAQISQIIKARKGLTGLKESLSGVEPS